MTDYQELAKLFLYLPFVIATVGALYLEFSAGWITYNVIITTLISFITLVIGYYWGKIQKQEEAGR